MNREQRVCQNCKQNFQIEPEDFEFYKKIDVPPPTFCPDCRVQRRMLWRNERFLHKRKSSLSGKEIISQHSKDSLFPVYDVREFFSRDWDPVYLDYDPNRSFFDQFRELQLIAPRPALLTDLQSFENGSVYQNYASRNKNCYMVSAAGDNEDCMYSNNIDYSRNSIDCLWCRRIEYSYECVDCLDSNRLFFSQECRQCLDSWFLYNCNNCSNCFGCVGLRNKSYCIWNKQLSKEEYEKTIGKIISQLSFDSINLNSKKLRELYLSFPVKYSHIDPKSSATSTGDYIVDSNNVFKSFTVHESQNIRYCSKIISSKDCFDVTDWGDPAELCYESITVGLRAFKVFFSNNCWGDCREIQYSDACSNSHHLFGCVGLKNSSFRILNKLYSEKEYGELTKNIISDMRKRGEYGEFFPPSFSPFPYNETIAQEYFPLESETALSMNYNWSDNHSNEYKITVKSQDLPISISNVNESILGEIIGCDDMGKCNHGCVGAFRIIKDELSFYKKFNIPLPRLCLNCRHSSRFSRRNPLKLWKRQCMCNYKSYENTSTHSHHQEGECPNTFETSYAPDRPEIVYCDQCYNAEIV